MYSRIITADISGHVRIFLISKDIMLKISNESIHITKREIKEKSIAYFKTLLSIVHWKNVLKLPQILRELIFKNFFRHL